MEESVRQRIISIIQEEGISINSLSKGNKAMQRKLNRQINEGAAITIETISSILDTITDISAEWLLRGIGEKRKSESLESIEELKAELNQLKGENRVLREQIGLGERKDSNSQSA